jgi:hypothetical protein
VHLAGIKFKDKISILETYMGEVGNYGYCFKGVVWCVIGGFEEGIFVRLNPIKKTGFKIVVIFNRLHQI